VFWCVIGSWYYFFSVMFSIFFSMAVVENTLTGFMSGSIGSDTFQNWKKRHIMRSKPVVQYNPNTPAQQANRIRFNGVRDFYAAVQSVVEPIMRRMDRKRAPFNAFAHRNMRLWAKGSAEMDISMMPSMDLGVGDFYHLDLFAMSWDTIEGLVVVSDIPYTPLLGYEQFWRAYVVYNYTKNVFWSIAELTESGRYGYYFSMPYDIGDYVVGWFVFYSVSYKWMSNTYFCEIITA
jgi:hypothetical protein